MTQVASRLRPLAFTLLAGLGLFFADASAATAEPYGDTPAERHFLAEVDQYLQRPRPTDVDILKFGHQACQVRRSGGSSDAAKAAVWKTWNATESLPGVGAEVGSLVHVAVDNLCPEVGYP